MNNKKTRREFIQLASLGAASLTAASISITSPVLAASTNSDVKIPFKLGMASYSLREFPTEKAIEMTNRLGLKYIAFKSMHLPLKSTPEQIKKIAAKVRDAGIELYGAGVVYMNSPQEVDQAFEYAKAAGMKVLIGVPKHELLPMVDKKVTQYDIKVAIHNHGPGDEMYPTPKSIYEKVKDLDPRIGLCVDIGHTQRMGIDPAGEIEKYKDRVLDVHLKDVDKAAAEGTTLEMGRGIIDIPKVLRTLIKIKFSGIASFEFEKDGNDPLVGMAESVGYTHGALAVIA